MNHCVCSGNSKYDKNMMIFVAMQKFNTTNITKTVFLCSHLFFIQLYGGVPHNQGELPRYNIQSTRVQSICGHPVRPLLPSLLLPVLLFSSLLLSFSASLPILASTPLFFVSVPSLCLFSSPLLLVSFPLLYFFLELVILHTVSFLSLLVLPPTLCFFS